MGQYPLIGVSRWVICINRGCGKGEHGLATFWFLLATGWRLLGSFWPLEAEAGHRRPNLATQEAPTAQRRALRGTLTFRRSTMGQHPLMGVSRWVICINRLQCHKVMRHRPCLQLVGIWYPV